MERTIKIDGRDITFRATARTVGLYKQLTGDDLMKRMTKFQTAGKKTIDDETRVLFENLAYVMAKQADPDLPEMGEWLDSFGMFSLLQAIPELSELWLSGAETSSVPKKKGGRPTVR